MARVIIQGTKEECKKTENTLRNLFTKCDKKATVFTEDEVMLVLDVYQERYGKDGFTDKEIELALTCHTSAVQRCDICPYRKETNCSEKLLADGALWFTRMTQKVEKMASKKEASEKK